MAPIPSQAQFGSSRCSWIRSTSLFSRSTGMLSVRPRIVTRRGGIDTFTTRVLRTASKSYLIERLKTCPMRLPADDGAPVEEMVERVYWDQAMGGLRRGLDESERLAKVLH